MSSSFYNFLPFKTKTHKVQRSEIESRPGLLPLDDPYDKPNDFPDKNPERPEELPEFHHTNMTFWWFIFGAIAISLFLYTVLFQPFGVDSSWYKNLKKYPGSGAPQTIWIGSVFMSFMLAWATYQMFKDHNIKIIRYGGIFLMVGIYVCMLFWSLLLYDSRSPRNSMLFLTFAWLMVSLFIILSLWSNAYSYEIFLPLCLAFLWLLYLMYYNAGIVNENDDSLFKNFSDIYGPDDELTNRINHKTYRRK